MNSWDKEVLPIPKKKTQSHGDMDDFRALKWMVDGIIAQDQLYKSVSVHNFSTLASADEPTVIYRMWPEPDKGSSVKVLGEIVTQLLL